MSGVKVKRGVTRVCSEEYGVVSLEVNGRKSHAHRRKPCEQCPWREDVPAGVFPPDAFRESAPTAYDGAMSTFSCHMSGVENPATCAGFLLRHAENNIGVRLSQAKGRIDCETVGDGGYPIYASYRDMAIANGVPADDPVLRDVRADGDVWDRETGRWVPSGNKNG